MHTSVSSKMTEEIDGQNSGLKELSAESDRVNFKEQQGNEIDQDFANGSTQKQPKTPAVRYLGNTEIDPLQDSKKDDCELSSSSEEYIPIHKSTFQTHPTRYGGYTSEYNEASSSQIDESAFFKGSDECIEGHPRTPKIGSVGNAGYTACDTGGSGYKVQ